MVATIFLVAVLYGEANPPISIPSNRSTLPISDKKPNLSDIISWDCGKSGSNVIGTLNLDSGVLTFSGTGEIQDYNTLYTELWTYIVEYPWWNYRDSINSVVIEDGVTRTGNSACFLPGNNKRKYKIASSVTYFNRDFCVTSAYAGNITQIYYFGTVPPQYDTSSFIIVKAFVDFHLPTIYQSRQFTDLTETNFQRFFREIPSGYCGKADVNDGKDVKWVLDKDDKKLIISGAGEWTKDFKEIATNSSEQPLSFKKSDIETIILHNGVTFGDISLDDFSSLKEIKVDVNHMDFQSIDGALFNKAGTKLIKCPAGRTSYEIPSNFTSIEADAFNGCRALTTIDVDNNNNDFQSIDGVLFNKAGTKLIKIPAGNNITFYEISSNVTSIEAYAFNGCSALTSVRFNGIGDLDSRDEKKIFKNFNSNLKINVPGEYVGDKFCGKDVIKDYYKITYDTNGGTLADGSPEIYYVNVSTNLIPPIKAGYDFSGWTVTNSSGTTPEPFVCICHDSTGDKSFTANWIKKMPTISGYCGKNDGENVIWMINTKFGTFTVSGTGEMADYISIIDINNMTLLGVRTMNDNTCPWNNYKGLIKSIIIKSGVTSIGKGAFSNCKELTSITISESVVFIGNSAFSDCSALETINFQGDKEPNFGNDVFTSCNIKTINVPNDYKGSSTIGGVNVTKPSKVPNDDKGSSTIGEVSVTEAPKNSKLSGGAKAGIAIGTFAAVSAIVGAVGLFLFFNNRQNHSTPEASDKAVPKEDEVPEAGETVAV